MTMSAPRLAPLDYGGILDRAFELYRENFTLFAAIAAMLLPFTLVNTWFSEAAQHAMARDPGHVFTAIVGTYAALAVYMWAASYVHAALAIAISNRYLEMPATMGASYAAVGRAFVPLTVTVLLSGLLVIVGFMLCLIPGIIFCYWVAFVVPVVMIEHGTYNRAIERSKQLVSEGQWVRVMILGILIAILIGVLTLVGSLTATYAAKALHLGAWPSYAVQALSTTLLVPFGHAVNIILYYDIRVRKEAFDLQLLASALGVPAPAAPPAAAESLFCTQCGKSVPAASAFCAWCGKPVPRA